MRKYEYNPLGIKGIKFDGSDSAAEFNVLANEKDASGNLVDACNDEAVANVHYRSTFPQWRTKLLTKVEEQTKIPWPVKEVIKNKDGTTRTVYENEGDYFDLVADTLVSKGDFKTAEQAKQSFAALAQTCADETKFDPSIKVSTAGPKTLPKMYKEAAERIIANGNWDKFSRFSLTHSATGDEIKDKAADVEALGWAIQAEALAKQRELAAGYK